VYNKTLMPLTWDTHTNLDEYWSLVNDCIIWDVSCQRQVELKGPDANKLAQYLSSRNLSKFKTGQGKYVLHARSGWKGTTLVRVHHTRDVGG
jgi:aminomethyltransferase